MLPLAANWAALLPTGQRLGHGRRPHQGGRGAHGKCDAMGCGSMRPLHTVQCVPHMCVPMHLRLTLPAAGTCSTNNGGCASDACCSYGPLGAVCTNLTVTAPLGADSYCAPREQRRAALRDFGAQGKSGAEAMCSMLKIELRSCANSKVHYYCIFSCRGSV